VVEEEKKSREGGGKFSSPTVKAITVKALKAIAVKALSQTAQRGGRKRRRRGRRIYSYSTII